MLIEYTTLLVSAGDPESVNVTVKLGLPGAVGVPEMVPVALPRVRPAGSDPAVTAHVYGAIPPASVSVTEYAEPTVPTASAPAGVVIVATTGMLSVVDAEIVVLPVRVAVMVTVNAALGEAGAVYVTVVPVVPLSAPHAEPLHPVPLSDQVTPAVLLVSVAVRVTASPGSTLLDAGAWILTVGELEPPHAIMPSISTETRKRQNVDRGDEAKALGRMGVAP
jgi:hypothetical protein